MLKGNTRQPLNRRLVLCLTALSSLMIGIRIGSRLGSRSSSDTSTESSRPSSSVLQQQQQQQQQESSSGAVNNEVCDLSSNLAHLQDSKVFDYPNQVIAGPMQADEMLLLFALVRASSVKRVLEVGGLRGDSAYNWLEALRCKSGGVVYTVDRKKVPQHEHPVVPHKTIIKDAADLVLADIDEEPIDLLLLDCHAYAGSQHILKAVFENNLLSENGFIVLHDTGMHPTEFNWHNWQPNIRTENGVIHQPVERLLADWIPLQDCSFQRISFHDDHRPYPRHGVTVLQRRLNLDFKECQSFAMGAEFGAFFDFLPGDCDQVQTYTAQVRETCPGK